MGRWPRRLAPFEQPIAVDIVGQSSPDIYLVRFLPEIAPVSVSTGVISVTDTLGTPAVDELTIVGGGFTAKFERAIVPPGTWILDPSKISFAPPLILVPPFTGVLS